MAVFNDKSTKDFRRSQRNNASRGEVQHENSKEYDAARDRKLLEIGVKTLRFPDWEVISNSELVLNAIRTVVTEMRENGESYRRPSTQLSDLEKARKAVGRGGDKTKPPPSPRLEKAGELPSHSVVER